MSRDQDRFLTLFLKHQRELAGIARALLPTWDAVDEVLQESSLVMWRKIEQLDSDEEFMPWASVILRFEVLKFRRRCSRDRLLLDESVIAMLAEESESGVPVVSEEQRAAVRECLGKLSVENRRLILAPFSSDDAVTRLAETVGKSANSLYKRLGRLRVKLRDCVEQQMRASL